MVQRITSGRVAQGASPFDPMAIARAGQAATQAFEPVVEAVDTAARKIDAFEGQQVTLTTRQEMARIDREVAADLAELAADPTRVPETGVGFSDGALAVWEARTAQALERAGDNPRLRSALEDQFRIDREAQLEVFERQERDFQGQYSVDQYLQTLDDFRQQVGRQEFVEPPATGDTDQFKVRLAHRETRGAANPYSVVNQYGYTGKYQWGQAHLDYITNRFGLPSMRVSDLRGNGPLQERLMDLSIQDMDERIAARGYDELIGQNIGGVIVTQDGMRAAMHGHGLGNLDDFIRSGGTDVHADGNGMTIAQTMTEFGVDANGIPNYNGPLPNLSANPTFADAQATLYAQIDAMNITERERAALRREADNALTLSAIGTIGEQNPSVALAMLRSGEYDDRLTYEQDQSAQARLANELEGQIAAQAQQRTAAARDEANRVADDYIDAMMAGIEGQPAPTPEEYALLSPEMREKVDRAPTVGAAQVFVESAPVEQLPAYLEALQQPGPNMAARLSAYEEVRSRAEGRISEDQARQRVEASTAAGIAPDMSNAGERAYVNRLFDEVVAASDTPLVAGADFAAEYNIVPDGFTQLVQRAMSSADPAVQEQAVRSVQALWTARPDLVAQMGRGAETALGIAARMDGYGQTFEEARRSELDLISADSATRRAALETEWDDGRIDGQTYEEVAIASLQEAVSVPDGMFGSIDMPEGVARQYAGLVRDYYLEGNPMEAALQKAEMAFRRTHGVSYIGSTPQWQRGAAEAIPELSVFADPRENAAAYEAQARDFAAQQFDGPIDDISLQPVGDPLREPSPRYTVWVESEGNIGAIAGEFVPDPAPLREVAIAGAGGKEDAAAIRQELAFLATRRDEMARELRVAHGQVFGAQVPGMPSYAAQTRFYSDVELRELEQGYASNNRELGEMSARYAELMRDLAENQAAFEELTESHAPELVDPDSAMSIFGMATGAVLPGGDE